MLSTASLLHTLCFPCKTLNLIFSWKHFLPEETNSAFMFFFPFQRRRQHDIHIMNNIVRRRALISLAPLIFVPSPSSTAKTKIVSPYDEKRLLERNRRLQRDNNVPEDFPNFIREGFQVKVITSDNYIKCDSGLIYLDIDTGNGVFPTSGQQVTFHYIGYNEAGRRIDNTYSQGTPARFRMGSSGLVPGFEEGIKNMRVGGKRRMIIPPELGPPVGPSTFFSSKQFEVFDVEVLSVQNCERRTIGFYSDLVCS